MSFSTRRRQFPERTWLRERRDQSVTLREFGEPYGLGSGQLSNLEQGNGSPVIATIPKYAQAYAMDPLEMCARFLAELENEVIVHG